MQMPEEEQIQAAMAYGPVSFGADGLTLEQYRRLSTPTFCECCSGPTLAICVRCQGLACAACDECQGCHRIICDDCNADPDAPRFAFPGDRYLHPHSVRADWNEVRGRP